MHFRHERHMHFRHERHTYYVWLHAMARIAQSVLCVTGRADKWNHSMSFGMRMHGGCIHGLANHAQLLRRSCEGGANEARWGMSDACPS